MSVSILPIAASFSARNGASAAGANAASPHSGIRVTAGGRRISANVRNVLPATSKIIGPSQRRQGPAKGRGPWFAAAGGGTPTRIDISPIRWLQGHLDGSSVHTRSCRALAQALRWNAAQLCRFQCTRKLFFEVPRRVRYGLFTSFRARVRTSALPHRRPNYCVAPSDAPGRERTRARGSLDSRLVERALNLPASPFKMHIAKAKGGWIYPAANLVRRT
jgi:hypothetical protein